MWQEYLDKMIQVPNLHSENPRGIAVNRLDSLVNCGLAFEFIKFLFQSFLGNFFKRTNRQLCYVPI